jgi:predicted permease
VVVAVVVALATTILAGLAPALRGARFDLAGSLHGGDGASAGGFRGTRARQLRRALLAFESAFAVLLLVGATLLARSFVRLTGVDAGYTADRVLTAQVYTPQYETADLKTPTGRAKAERMTQIVDTLLTRLRAAPSVAAAGAGNMLPLDGMMQIAGFPAPWTRPGSPPGTARALLYTVTPGYAEALGLRLRAGRLFTEGDVNGAVRSWIVNEEFARQYLPRPAVGYRFEQPGDGPPLTVEIIGVVANVLKSGNDSKPQAEVYLLMGERAAVVGRFEVAVRTSGEAAALAPTVRTLVREIEPDTAVRIVTLSERVSDSVAQPRFATVVLAAFAVLALALASVGLYGVLSYGVSQRRRELGVRAALGASRGELLALVVREGLTTSGIGLALGLAAAALLTRLMQGVLFGVTPLDPLSFAAAPLALLVVACAASLLPGRRAASTDPAEALRCE